MKHICIMGPGKISGESGLKLALEQSKKLTALSVPSPRPWHVRLHVLVDTKLVLPATHRSQDDARPKQALQLFLTIAAQASACAPLLHSYQLVDGAAEPFK